MNTVENNTGINPVEWETVIGLEVHIQLQTKSKIFSASSTEYGAVPNMQACLIDLGFPGVLPVLNREAVLMAIKFGLAVQGDIAPSSVFARKNYFYPDLPKGYQISQHTAPIVQGGHLDIVLEEGQIKRIHITRAHLEEDSGKMLHDYLEGMSAVDFNRSGISLLEIVSEPDLRSAKEAVSYLKTLHTLVRYLGICDGNLQEGSFRCDVNVSVRPTTQRQLGTRAEIKNMNSFRFIERAIQYEVERQIKILTNNGKVMQETRLYDVSKNQTRAMRNKEEAHDYRYFPEPDLVPLHVSAEMIERVRQTLPELPQDRKIRLIKDFKMTPYEADVLVTSRELGDYFEQTIKLAPISPKLAINWILGELSAALNTSGGSVSECPIQPQQLANLLTRIHDQTISGTLAKEIFEALWQKEGSVDDIIEHKGLKQVTNIEEISELIDQVIAQYPQEVERYRGGEVKLFGFLVGQVMKNSKGKANPQQVNALLKEKL